MNIETANRLYQYRKKMGISQEELAARIGVSRQAVSKWERAEASPDTDNLIELAKVYGLTLDELLQGKDEEASSEETAEAEKTTEGSSDDKADDSENVYDYETSGKGIHIDEDGEHVHIGLGGIHVLDKDGTEVHVDRKHGVFVSEKGEKKVYTDENGHIHKSEDVEAFERKNRMSPWLAVPYPIIALIAYLLFGYFNVCGGWAFGWIVFLTIPVYYSLVDAIRKRNASLFAYPVFAVVVFLIMGFVWGLWHPGWVIFLTVPIYYTIVNALKKK